MSSSQSQPVDAASQLAPQRKGVVRRWQNDTRGVTAIEFGMVAVPFMMMLFGIIAVGLFYFTTFTLENSVEQAARLLRTGQAQQAGYTTEQFKSKICEFVPGHIDGAGKLRVNVLSFADTTDITPAALPGCLSADNTLSNETQYEPGDANQVMLVWVCYEWELAGKLPFIRFGNMANGSALIQATSVFRAEPFVD